MVQLWADGFFSEQVFLTALVAFGAGLVGGAAILNHYERSERERVIRSCKLIDATHFGSIKLPASELFDRLAKYHRNLNEKSPARGEMDSDLLPVVPRVQPGTLVHALPDRCPEEPESYADIFRDLEKKVLPALTQWASPGFFAYFKPHASEPSILAELACAAINVVGFTWAAAPAATELEQVVCNWVARLMGLPPCFVFGKDHFGGGCIEGSASESALCAMIAARIAALKGYEGDERALRSGRLCAYISDQTHAIGLKNCMILDITHVRTVKTYRGKVDPGNYGMAADDLKTQIKEDLENDLVPFFVILTVGTTSTAAIDPVRDIAIICKALSPSLWIHIDGAYGGAATVCPEYRHWLEGADLCDSVCVNAHKWMMMNVDCSLFWVQDRRVLTQALTQDPEYLKNDHMTQLNYKDWQVPLGRRFRALKVWFTLRRMGASGMQAHIRRSMELAKRAEARLIADGRFEIFVPTRMSLTCFYVRFGGRQLNEELIRRVNASGKAFFVHTIVDQTYVIRMAVGGLEIDEWHVDHGVDVLIRVLDEIVAENPKWKEEEKKAASSRASYA